MSKCVTYSNPHYVPLWSDEEHEYFLKWAFQYYCSKAPNPRMAYSRDLCKPEIISSPIQENLIEHLYRLGRDFQVLRFSYQEFHSWICTIPSVQYSPRCRVNSPFRHKQKYQKQLHHKRKLLNPVCSDWRKSKGFERDYRKSKWRRSAPMWAHRISARARRQWERIQLHRKNWDDLASGDYLRFIDPWIWD